MPIISSDPRAEKLTLNLAKPVQAGYRHFDTAANYGNEQAVGDVIRQSSVPRSEIFVATKLACVSLIQFWSTLPLTYPVFW